MTRTSVPGDPNLLIPDAFGLHWSMPDYLVDWVDRLMLRAVQGPEWRFDAILSSFDTLPGELTDLLQMHLDVANRGDALEVTVQGGRWEPEAGSHPLGKAALCASVQKALIWLPAWRLLASGTMIRIFGLPEEFEGPWLGDDWLMGDYQKVEIASRSASV
jgi:hypothetical protein